MTGAKGITKERRCFQQYRSTVLTSFFTAGGRTLVLSPSYPSSTKKGSYPSSHSFLSSISSSPTGLHLLPERPPEWSRGTSVRLVTDEDPCLSPPLPSSDTDSLDSHPAGRKTLRISRSWLKRDIPQAIKGETRGEAALNSYLNTRNVHSIHYQFQFVFL